MGKFFFRYGFQELLTSVPQRRLGDMLIGLTMKGNQSRTTDFAELEQCCRTTYGHFLSAGKWDEGKVSEKQQQEVFRVASQLAVESKEEFWRRYQEGDTPRTIMYDLGYDPEALGRNRLSGIQNAVCKQAVSAKGFQERPQSRRGEGAAGGGDTTTQAQLRQMQHRLKYLEQEVEFLKKYPLLEVRESKGCGHERGVHHLFPDPPGTVRQRE